MYMIRHNYKSTYLQVFGGSAILKAVNNNIAVALPAEDIDPSHDGKGHKIRSGLVTDLISACIFIAHKRGFSSGAVKIFKHDNTKYEYT